MFTIEDAQTLSHESTMQRSCILLALVAAASAFTAPAMTGRMQLRSSKAGQCCGDVYALARTTLESVLRRTCSRSEPLRPRRGQSTAMGKIKHCNGAWRIADER